MRTTHYPVGPMWRVLIADLGLEPTDVMRRAGLPEGLLSDPRARLAPAEFYRFWTAMEGESGDDHFAIRFNASLSTEVFSPPVFAAMCSPDLATAIRRLSTYKALVAPMEIAVREEGDSVTFAPVWYGADTPPPESLVLADLLFILRVGKAGTRRPMTATRVWSEALTAPRPGYQHAFGAAIEHGEGHGIAVRRKDAETPFLTANEQLWADFEPELRRRLARLEGDAPAEERAHAVLLEALPSGTYSLAHVAQRLAMSERTLQRQLRQSGSSYKEVLDSTRKQLAMSYLRRASMPPAEIAFLLGFAELTSFYRAFRRWTGSTPDTFRQKATG